MPVRVTWFYNRIEISNPGGPFGIMNRQNFGQPGIADYRKPNLDGAIGSHAQAVQEAYKDFQQLAEKILERMERMDSGQIQL